MPELQVHGKEKDYCEKARRKKRDQHGGQPNRTLAQQVNRQERRLVVALVPGERRNCDGRNRNERETRHGEPPETMSCRRQPEERCESADREKRVTSDIRPCTGARVPLSTGQAAKAPGRERCERQAGDKEPTALGMGHHDTSDDGTADARRREREREVTLEPYALERRHELANKRLRQHHQPSSAQSLQYSPGNELRQRLSQSARERAQRENAKRD